MFKRLSEFFGYDGIIVFTQFLLIVVMAIFIGTSIIFHKELNEQRERIEDLELKAHRHDADFIILAETIKRIRNENSK